MGIEETCQSDHYEDEENPEEEFEFDLEGQLISSLEELRKRRNNYKSLKTQFVEYKKEQESREEEATKGLKKVEEIIVELRTKLDEAKRIKESLKE